MELCLDGPVTCPTAWLSHGQSMDRVCQLQPDPREKVYFTVSSRLSFQT